VATTAFWLWLPGLDEVQLYSVLAFHSNSLALSSSELLSALRVTGKRRDARWRDEFGAPI
jgi:hypothetical protein